MKILLCLAFHYVEENIKNLKKVINNVIDNYKYPTTIIIDTNDERTILELKTYNIKNLVDINFNETNIYINVINNLQHSYHLTWIHRQHILNYLELFDFVIYSEDDILIPFNCILDFNKKIYKMWPTHIPCYRRVEFSYKLNDWVCLDITSKNIVNTQNNSDIFDKIIEIDNKKYITPKQAYQGFWMLNVNLLKFVLKIPEIKNNFMRYNLHREHAASFTLGPPPWHNYDINYNGYAFLNIIPLYEIHNNKFIIDNIVYHTANKYVDTIDNSNVLFDISEYIKII